MDWEYAMLNHILLSFIPLFVAVDAIGILPIFVSLTEGVEQKVRTKIIVQSMLTAAGLAIAFVLVGKLVFKFLGITMGDFMIAGGVILFCLAIIDMVGPIKKRRIPGPERAQGESVGYYGRLGSDTVTPRFATMRKLRSLRHRWWSIRPVR